MNYENERRGSKNRALERSMSYSEAIGNGSGRSSIEITSIVNTDVYTNEELKKHYRISQTYVEGKEIAFPTITTNSDSKNYLAVPDIYYGDSSFGSSEDEQADNGLIMTIDIEQDSPKSSETTKPLSEASTRPLESFVAANDIFDRIENDDSQLDTETYVPVASAHGYSTPYSKRKKKATHRRRHGRRIHSRRAVLKNGEENVPVRSKVPAKFIKYMRDIVNTIINSKWRFIFLMMVISHFVFWFFFAGIWYAVSTSYQDDIGDGKEHCVTGTRSFAGMLMMSVETQMTIGYGVRYPNEECPEAIIIMVFEIVAGTALSGGLSSLLFTKLIRPNRQVASVGFSRKATVCLRDGELCLQFRVWDLMNVHLIGSTITAYMLKPIRTLEGELVHNYIHQLELNQARAFLLWPITVVHVIDAKSPLYDLSAQDMMDYSESFDSLSLFGASYLLTTPSGRSQRGIAAVQFEIVVCLTGASKNMGATTQSRTSYLSKEILWGYRFKNVVHYSKKDGAYTIDSENLNSVDQVETPLCSASYLKEIKEDLTASTNVLSSPNISPTDFSLDETTTLSKADDSLPSSPSLNRTGTQRSFGWNFRRFYPERYARNLDVRAEIKE